MIKKIFFFFLFLSISFNMYSQEKSSKRIFTGAIQAGYNASTLFKEVKLNKSGFLHSFHAGVLGTTNMNWLNFEIGLFYSEKGGSISTPENNFAFSKYKLHYLEVPANIVLKIPIGIKIYPYAGATLGGLIKANDISNNQKVNIYRQLKKVDIGINVGVGIDVFGFNIKAGAVVGTTPIYSNGPKNLVFTIALSYIF